MEDKERSEDKKEEQKRKISSDGPSTSTKGLTSKGPANK
jgi:hypothetical protein